MYRSSTLCKVACVLLSTLLVFSGCATQVVISKPFHEKLRIGDGIKITVMDGTIHSGRILYLDRATVVIRTPKQTKAKSPVEIARFGTTVPWNEVVLVKVAGTLDSQRKLISNEEIRVNVRTNRKRNMGINIGLLGLGFSFLAGVYFQDQISPPTIDLTNFRHTQGRTAFWFTVISGSLASTFIGFKIGEHWDRSRSIARIERQRETAREIARAAARVVADSLNNAQNLRLGPSPLKF